MFMATTRKLDPDGLLNSIVGRRPSRIPSGILGCTGVWDVALYAGLVGCGLVIHYSILVLSISPVFWLTSAQGSKAGTLPWRNSRACHGSVQGRDEHPVVWLLPVVVVSNAPARVLLHGFELRWALWISRWPSAGLHWPCSSFTAACAAMRVPAREHRRPHPARDPHRPRVPRPVAARPGLTHSSLLPERGPPPRQPTAQYLGDAVLQLILTERCSIAFPATGKVG